MKNPIGNTSKKTKVFYPNYTKCKYFTKHIVRLASIEFLVHRDTLTAVWAVRVLLYALICPYMPLATGLVKLSLNTHL